jgi:signal transduction histidine kinase/ActR/RegA family two-component response regulator
MSEPINFRSASSDERKSVRSDVAHGRTMTTELNSPDIQELQRRLVEQEAQLRQLQKMETVSRLAGGVAHDFNNLLTVILGRSDVLLAGLPAESTIREGLEEIKRASERAADLTRQLLVFSRKHVYRPRVVELNALVADMEKMLGRLIGETIQLHTSLADAVPPIKADPGQLEQVILNLVVNARDAMPSGGTLTIATAGVLVDDRSVQLPDDILPGAYSMFSVSDTGSGMSPEVQARMFEPFFTTKEKGQGTGLGLATVRGIVQQAGGYIGFSSEAARGSTFRVYLPALPAGSIRAPQQKSSVRPRRGSETILVVEDERQVRELVITLLRDQGYRVLAAANGREAVEAGERRSGSIDLLLADVMLPDLSGPELAERLAATRPDMRALYMSGYTGSVILRRSALRADVPFLAKPFTPAVLSNKVRRALHSKAARILSDRTDV